MESLLSSSVLLVLEESSDGESSGSLSLLIGGIAPPFPPSLDTWLLLLLVAPSFVTMLRTTWVIGIVV